MRSRPLTSTQPVMSIPIATPHRSYALVATVDATTSAHTTAVHPATVHAAAHMAHATGGAHMACMVSRRAVVMG